MHEIRIGLTKIYNIVNSTCIGGIYRIEIVNHVDLLVLIMKGINAT